MVKKSKYLDSTKKHLALIAPLDWGLGHTTRCIPIIRELKNENFEIVIACNSIQKSVLQTEFPGEVFIHLDGYGLRYGKSRFFTFARLVLQIPKILISIKHEKLQLIRILSRIQPDCIISDNRYGFFSSDVHSILITHQLNLATGGGKIADKIASIFIKRFINRFDECWIPDFAPPHNLAGDLSKPGVNKGLPVKHLGPLSRFDLCPARKGIEDNKPGFILIILSGPEPQRTIFENILLPQLKQLPANDRKIVIVRGLPGTTEHLTDTGSIQVINFAETAELNRLVCDAAVVICRAGYSSVMDLMKLKKKSILVPTPGQGEQEYLGEHLESQKLAVVRKQSQLKLEEALKMTGDISIPDMDMEAYKKVIASMIATGF